MVSEKNKKVIIITVIVVVVLLILCSIGSSILWAVSSDDPPPPAPPAYSPPPAPAPVTPPTTSPSPAPITPPSPAPITPPPPAPITPPSPAPAYPGPWIQESGCSGYLPLKSKGDISSYDLDSIPMTSAITLDTCIDKCNKNEQCDWVTWGLTTPACILKSFSKKDSEPGASTWFKLSDSKCNYYGTNVPSAGTQIGSPIKNVANMETCWELCKNNASCDVAHYESNDQDCLLLEANKGNDFISYFPAYKD